MVSMTYQDLADARGRELGASRVVTLGQDRIDGFADISEDQQWIHVDRERATTGPFGTTIAHGYLTLSLVGTLLGELLDVTPDVVLVNYGLQKVRFPSPVPAGSKLAISARVTEVEPTPHGLRLTIEAVGKVEGHDRPACVVEALALAST